MSLSNSVRERPHPDTNRRKHPHTPLQQNDVGRLQLAHIILCAIGMHFNQVEEF